MIGTRQPTIDEAVEIIMKIITREFRREQVTDWRQHFGDQFADAVQAKVREQWKGRRK